MDTRRLLDQLLKSGQQMLGQSTGKPAAGQGLGGMLGSSAGGLLAGGALGVLLGNKKARKYGGKVAMYGGLAALGVLAYKAYGNWQARQGQAPAEPHTIDRVPPAIAQAQSQVILGALVAAAKADGHVDARERELIEGEFTRLEPDRAFHQWLHAELEKPLNPAEVARTANTPELAAEVYLASALVIDRAEFMEQAYLDELARQLRLDPGLRAELDAQVNG